MTPSPSGNSRPIDSRVDAAMVRDRDLVARVRRGDLVAFETMYRAYKDDLGAYAQSLLRSREAAEEVIQDLFCRIWEQRELWELAGPLNAYLFRATRNRDFNYLRHQQVEKKFHERTTMELAAHLAGKEPVMPNDAVYLHELEDAVEQAIESLPARCREVFRLNRYQGLSYAEVAKTLQISVKTVEMQMGRALTALRRKLTDWRE